MGFGSFLKKKENQFYLNKLTKKSKKVLALEEQMATLSDDELQEKTNEFRHRFKEGESLDQLLTEAFAVVREASFRVLGMKHFPVQVIGGIALHEGNIAEMMTGEGKTLVATLPAYLNALTGKGVHIITVNEYLAQRDHDILAPLYHFLGLTTAVVTEDLSKEEKKEAYQQDIVFLTNTEVGFDYLRDNMVSSKEEKVQGDLHFCIVDEVDSVLLDDARTPLIISSQGDTPSNLYYVADLFVRMLKKDVDLKVNEELKSVYLTAKGIEKAEKMFRVENLADVEHGEIRFHIDKALQAHYTMMLDRDYIIHQNSIQIIDESTGRISEGRRFSHGLHQALEAKEGVRIQRENKTMATITYQNFFLLYDKLSGMTGTASTNAEEFKDIYRLNIVTIPTNKPVQRKDLPDKLYVSMQAKNKAIVADVRTCYETGQPVLIGTSSIEKSEELSELLTREGIPHVVLNAKNHAKEAEIIAQAGQKYAVTIATNMAGRGTDIKLGEGVIELGGLKVIGTERASNRRIDNQLVGRSGRQGDPGVSQFYLSFDDDLLRIFTPEHIRKRVELLSNGDEPIELGFLIRSIHSAQARLEGSHFEARKQTIEYDIINNEQRTILYEQRNALLEEKNLLVSLRTMVESSLNEQFDSILSRLQTTERDSDEWNLLQEEVSNFFDIIHLPIEEVEELTKPQQEMIRQQIKTIIQSQFQQIESTETPENLRMMVLQVVDRVWVEHLETLEELKEVVRFSGYKQTKPVDEYSRLAFEAFEKAMRTIRATITTQLMAI